MDYIENSNSLIGRIALEVIEKSVKETKNLPGDMAEFGVYLGGSARIIANCAPSKLLHLFDTFSEQPFDDIMPIGFKKGDFRATLDQVKNYLYPSNNIIYHVGIFQEIELPEVQYSFVHIDADLYQNITFAIDYFYPRLIAGGIIVFDDFDNWACGGVRKAIEEKELIDKINITPNYTQALLKK